MSHSCRQDSGVVWFHHTTQLSLPCHCLDTVTGYRAPDFWKNKIPTLSYSMCFVSIMGPLQEQHTFSKVMLNFSRIIIYAYTFMQYPTGVEQELPTTHTFCQQSIVSLFSQSYSHEVVCSVVTNSGSEWLLSPLMSPKNPPLPRQMAGYTPKEQFHRKPLLCVGMLPREAELLLLLFYFHLLFSPWVSSLVCHPIHILLSHAVSCLLHSVSFKGVLTWKSLTGAPKAFHWRICVCCLFVICALYVLSSDGCTQAFRIIRKVMGMVEFQNTGFHATVRRFKSKW